MRPLLPLVSIALCLGCGTEPPTDPPFDPQIVDPIGHWRFYEQDGLISPGPPGPTSNDCTYADEPLQIERVRTGEIIATIWPGGTVQCENSGTVFDPVPADRGVGPMELRWVGDTLAFVFASVEETRYSGRFASADSINGRVHPHGGRVGTWYAVRQAVTTGTARR